MSKRISGYNALGIPILIYIGSAIVFSLLNNFDVKSNSIDFITSAFLLITLSYYTIWYFQGFKEINKHKGIDLTSLSIFVLFEISLYFLYFSTSYFTNVNYENHLTFFDNVIFMLILVLLIAPVAEELIFRKLLYDYFSQKHTKLFAVVFTSSIWGLMHYNDNIALLVLTILLGVIFAVSRIKTNGIKQAVVMHVFHNLFFSVFLWYEYA